MTTKMKRMIVIFFVAVLTLGLPQSWQLPLLIAVSMPYEKDKNNIWYVLTAGVLFILTSYFHPALIYLNVGQAIVMVVSLCVMVFFTNRIGYFSWYMFSLFYLLMTLVIIGFGAGLTGLVMHTLTPTQFLPFVSLTMKQGMSITIVLTVVLALWYHYKTKNK